MSGYLQGQVWFYDVRGSERDVLLAMADHAHDDGTHVYPSMDYLAWKVGVSKRQAQRIVGSLKKRGALIVVREATRYDPTHYRMVLDALDRKPEWAGVTSTSSLVRGDKSDDSGVTSEPDRGDIQMSPETSRTTVKETSATERARAKIALPVGFPDELRPHLTAVYRVLRDLAERHEARDVKPIALANVVMARKHKPLVRAAHDFAAWADGRSRRQRDVVASYRNWLNNEDDLAVVERLGDAAAAVNGNGAARRLRDRTFDGVPFGDLPREQQENLRESQQLGYERWDGGKDAPASRTNGHVNGHAAVVVGPPVEF